MDRPQVHGHRGSRATHPENTLAGFNAALEAGATAIELDLNITRDRALVIHHDPYLNPYLTLDASGQPVTGRKLIFEMDLRELQTFDVGSRIHPQFKHQQPIKGCRIPTLSQLFASLQASNHPKVDQLQFNLEMKVFDCRSHPSAAADELVEILIGEMDQSKIAPQRLRVQSFHAGFLEQLRKQRPSLTLGYLIEDLKTDPFQNAQRAKVQTLSPRYDLLDAMLVTEARRQGYEIITWTLNDESQWRHALDLGVDGIITDDPQGLTQYLDELERSNGLGSADQTTMPELNPERSATISPGEVSKAYASD